jgi:Family of unknown function (DUF6744)
MRELQYDYEQLPILGHIIWYGLTGIKTDRTTLLHLLQQHGFQGYAPEPPTDKLALQRALREWIRQRGATQRHAGGDEDETATRALIRPINKRRAKYAVYAIVAEEVDFALLGLYHGTSMRILLEKLEPEERAQRQPKLICTTDAIGEIAAENEVRQVTDELRPIWETYRHLYLSEDLGRMMRAIVEGIPNTIRTRKGGTVYFVPASEKQTLLAFKQLIESLPVDPGSAYTPHLIMVPIVDEAHARQELARAVHIGFVADLEALDKSLDDLRSKVKNVSPDAITRRLEKFKAVRDRARTYATLLSLQQATIAEKIDALHQKATAMLTENDDEQLPEPLVSVAAVPPQELARRTAPAIGSLIDDDPDAPF